MSDSGFAIHEGHQLEEEEQQHLQSRGIMWSCYPSSREMVLSDKMIRAIFLLLGVGILIPWNAFVSAKPYFTARFCKSGHDVVNFEQWFGLVWNLSSVCSLGLIIVGQFFSDLWKKRREGGRVVVDGQSNHDSSSNDGSSDISGDSSFFNVMVPLGLYTIVFSIQALLVTIPEISPIRFLVVTLIGLALCGTCGAIAIAGIVSTAGRFPSHIGMNPFFSGQALGGAAVSIANFVAIAVGEDPNDYLQEHCDVVNGTREVLLDIPLTSISTERRVDDASNFYRLLETDHDCSSYQDLDWAVFSYFLLGCIVLLLCLVGFQVIHKHQSVSYATVEDQIDDSLGSNATTNPYRDEIEVCSPRIGVELNNRICERQRMHSNETTSRRMTTPPSDTSCLRTPQEDFGSSERGTMHQIEADVFDDEGGQIPNDDSTNDQSIVSAIKGPATCIFLTFTITLSLFPSWISELKSNQECESRFRVNNDLYVPFSFVFFNVGDLLGRLISGYIPVDRIRKLSLKLVVCAILRVGFLPLFLMCNTTVGADSTLIIRNDFYSLLVQLLFSVSNGLLVSTAFVLSPQLVGSSSKLQKRASEIMTFSVCFGLLSGSFLAFPLLQLAWRVLEKH